MVDIVDPKTRSRMMAGIRSTNTKPELTIRRALHRKGLRYRVHSKAIPGRPDLVFPRYRAVVFIHGCFWHGHECSFFRMPSTRPDFWNSKIMTNRKRDERVRTALADAGWRQLTIWECAVRDKTPRVLENVIARAARWIQSKEKSLIIRGK